MSNTVSTIVTHFGSKAEEKKGLAYKIKKKFDKSQEGYKKSEEKHLGAKSNKVTSKGCVPGKVSEPLKMYKFNLSMNQLTLW